MDPLLQASPAIQIHVYAAVAATLLGVYVFARRKGTRAHRLAGRMWVLLMVVVCVSSFAIHELNVWGPWSPIHILSVATLVFLALAIRFARQGRIRSHRWTMISTYAGALLIAGAFSFMPGRIMHEFAVNLSAATVRSGGALLADLPLIAWPLAAALAIAGLWRNRDRLFGR
ncbi:DUF2306 domain-containing protein [Hoeflea poritis]|uniref:DUF2306 domain-containing protein n=1 Tax=Hoeflea poritis TaxID=2993659 RepID=UPI002FDC1AB1